MNALISCSSCARGIARPADISQQQGVVAEPTRASRVGSTRC